MGVYIGVVLFGYSGSFWFGSKVQGYSVGFGVIQDCLGLGLGVIQDCLGFKVIQDHVEHGEFDHGFHYSLPPNKTLPAPPPLPEKGTVPEVGLEPVVKYRAQNPKP